MFESVLQIQGVEKRWRENRSYRLFWLVWEIVAVFPPFLLLREKNEIPSSVGIAPTPDSNHTGYSLSGIDNLPTSTPILGLIIVNFSFSLYIFFIHTEIGKVSVIINTFFFSDKIEFLRMQCTYQSNA